MSPIGNGAPAAPPFGPCPRASVPIYHSSMQAGHVSGGHFFTPGAIPEPPPMPESHSP